jgi:small-conductance mechanosensitive channel
MGKVSPKISWQIIKNTLFPLSILLVFFTGYLFYRLKIFPLIPLELHQELKKYIGTILIICISFVIQRVVSALLKWYKENIAVKTDTPLDNELIPLIGKFLKIIIWVLAILIILPLYGVNISALIATLGVSSLAIALAAQDTISNIIAGFMIMIDRPFRIGDKIKLPSGEVVEVLELGVRRSKFLSQDKAIVIVPNLELSKSKIINYTYGEERIKNQNAR